MLIPSVSNAIVDKQRIIKVLKRNRGAISPELDSVSHVTGIKRARPTITQAAQGNKTQLFLLMLLSTVNCVALFRERRVEKKAAKESLRCSKDQF